MNINDKVQMKGDPVRKVYTVTGFLPAGLPCKSGKIFKTDRWILDGRYVSSSKGLKKVLQ